MPHARAPRALPGSVVMVVYASDAPSHLISAALVERGHSVLERPLGHARERGGDFEVPLVVAIIDPRRAEDRDLLQDLSATHPGAAILVVSLSSSEDAILAAFDAGAHACLRATENAQVVAAQASALAQLAAGDRCDPESSERVAVGDITIDMARRQVRVAGNLVSLTRSELEVLIVLVRQAGRVVTPTEILVRAGQPAGSEGQARDIVKAHVCRLRQKLGMPPDGAIQTVRGVGYVLDRRATQPPAVGGAASLSPELVGV